MESMIRTKWWEEQKRIPFLLKGFGRKTGEKYSIYCVRFWRKSKCHVTWVLEEKQKCHVTWVLEEKQKCHVTWVLEEKQKCHVTWVLEEKQKCHVTWVLEEKQKCHVTWVLEEKQKCHVTWVLENKSLCYLGFHKNRAHRVCDWLWLVLNFVRVYGVRDKI